MLTHREKQEILDLMEAQVKALQGVSRIEKIQMTKRIRRAVDSLTVWQNVTPEIFTKRLEHKLADIFSMFPYGFKRDFLRVISEQMKRIRAT